MYPDFSFSRCQPPDKPRVGTRRPRSGFALIISLILMAFVVVLMLSLSALTLRETKTGSDTLYQSAAKQNAILALNTAIAQLQIYTGPDQRTTARADMNTALANTTTANGRWLGAYGNGAVIDTGYSAQPSQIPDTILVASNKQGSQAVLLNWLVSGNENTNFSPKTDIAADGHIRNAPSNIAFTPANTVNLATATSTPTATDTYALLIGEHTVAAIADRVAAPLVVITGHGGDSTGRYAWWVGDEGAKARINLPLPSGDEIRTAFVTTPRNGIEWIDKLNPTGTESAFSSSDLIGTAYDPTSNRITSLETLGHLSALGISPAVLQLRYHDLTPHANSVLSDTYAGGLKQDLSALLATGATYPADNEPLFTTDSGHSFRVPTWGQLRSFARTTVPTDGLPPRLPTDTQTGIAPILTYASLGMRYIAPDGNAQNQPIRLALFPLVVLWNPYTFPIHAAQYEVGFTRRGDNPMQLQVKVSDEADWRAKETIDFSYGLSVLTPNAGSPHRGDREAGSQSESYVRFIVDAPQIPPGGSLIFSIQGSESGKDFDAPFDAPPTNRLTNGLAPDGHVLVNKDAVFEADEVGKVFRLTVSDFRNPTPWGWTPGNSVSMSGGEISVYLGEVSAPRFGYEISDSNDKRWYQFITRVWPARDGNANNIHLQGEAPLSTFGVPSAALSVQMIFDGSKSARWLAQGNPRALTSTRTPGNGTVLNYEGGLGMATPWQSFSADEGGQRASAGYGLDSASSIIDVTLFEYRPDDQPLLSLGQLQHANLSGIHAYPAYAIGNSLGDFRFKNNRHKVALDMSGSMAGENMPTSKITRYYDLSWLLNRALWDRYFVSSIPHAGTGTSTASSTSAIPLRLPNSRIQYYGSANDSTLRNADNASSALMLAGGFNINSTSEQAWRAVLSGINALPYDPVNSTGSTDKLKAALSRFAKPTAPPAPDADDAWVWQGFRQLSDEQIATLATNIVSEIRQRGPFISLADFVNRRLVDNPDSTGAFANEQFRGVIQAAIDKAHTGSAAINSGDASPFGSDTVPDYRIESVFDEELLRGYVGSGSGHYPIGSVSAFAPQFLTQADVLSAIGPGLSARSDTFTIRAYGDVVSPQGDQPLARAWCEAIVQRVPEYIAPANATPSALPAAGTLGQQFGRRYIIISFRWLSADEI